MTSAAIGPTTVISTENAPRNTFEAVLVWLWIVLLGVLLGLTLFLAWLVQSGTLYTADSRLAYHLGLWGVVMMLILCLYPLRKRVKWFDRLGQMAGWFRYHMFFGIAGPVLVLFHSTFHTRSMNGTVALWSMILVAGSGIVGRFVYRHVHLGLYGSQMTLADAEKELNSSAKGMKSLIALQPEIGSRLETFRAFAFDKPNSRLVQAWRFFTLEIRSRRLRASIWRGAKQILAASAKHDHWTKAQLTLHQRLAHDQIRYYLDAICKAAQFTIWERIFSLWHVVHIPFIYLLVLSGIAHVLAVHMY